MPPFISGIRTSGQMGIFKQIDLSQPLFVRQRDFEFFWKHIHRPHPMRLIIMADRPAELAKSAIFEKNIKNHEKYDFKISYHKIAQNGQMFPPKFLVKLLTLFFILKNFFSKKVAQLQKYSFLTKIWSIFDHLTLIFFELPSHGRK